MTLRDRFEAWAVKPPREWNINRYQTRLTLSAWPGQYRNYHVQCAWEAYQSAMEDAGPRISAKELKLATAMLKDYTDHLACQCCNDWDFPEDWSEVEKADFVRRYHEWNGDPEEFRPDFLVLPDFAVASFLAHLLSNNE